MNDGTDFASAEKWDRTWAIDGELRTMNVSVACCVAEGDFPTSKLIDEYCPIAPNANNSYSNIVSSYTLYCASPGMPNLRKNPFYTDFLRLFLVYGHKIIYGRIYGFFLTWLGYYPPPPTALSDRGIVRKKRIVGRIYGFFSY